MALESATYISELTPTNPAAGDPANQGDDHIRMIKAALQATLTGFNGPIAFDDIARRGSLNTFSTDGGYTLTLERTAAPSSFTVIGEVAFQAKDSTNDDTVYAQIRGRIEDETNGTEDGLLDFRTIDGGSSGVKFLLGRGFYSINATGGDQGTDSINISDLYMDGSVIFCAPIEEAKHGSYNREEWAALSKNGGLEAYEAMKARGYRATSADDFASEVMTREGIPGIWNKEEGRARLERTRPDHKGRMIVDRVSVADRIERMLLALDLQALAIVDLVKEKDELKARIEVLEAARPR